MSTDDPGWAEPTPVTDDVWATPTHWQTPAPPAIPAPPAPPASAYQPVRRPVDAPRRLNRGIVAIVLVASLAVVGLAIVAVSMIMDATSEPASEAAVTADAEEQTSPKSTPEVTRDPSDYATGPDGLALPGKLTKDTRLPAHAIPLGENFLADPQVGRVLGLYDVHTKDLVNGEWVDNPGPVVLYLATSAGELRQVLELPRGPEYQLVQWDVGEPTALIALWEPGANGPFSGPPPQYQTLNLLTGEMSDPEWGALQAPYLQYLGDLGERGSLWVQSEIYTPEFSIHSPQRVVVQGPSGEVTVLAELPITRPSSSFLVSPGMQQLAIQGSWNQATTIVDLSTGEVKTVEVLQRDNANCAHVGWYSDYTLFLACEGWVGEKDYGYLARFSLFTGEAVETLLTYDSGRGQDLDLGAQAVFVADNVIHTMAAPESGYTCRNGAFYVGDDDYAPTAWIDLDAEEHSQYWITGTTSTKVYAVTTGDCPQGPWLAEFSVLDVPTDTVTVLFPALELPREQLAQNSGLVSVALGQH